MVGGGRAHGHYVGAGAGAGGARHGLGWQVLQGVPPWRRVIGSDGPCAVPESAGPEMIFEKGLHLPAAVLSEGE